MDTIKRFWNEHPVLSNWLVLAFGMVVVMAITMAGYYVLLRRSERWLRG